ncbi:hypothetical protein Lalb_Chr14g0364881 [Lupinus albus]|uniref:Encoded peptide n=1 Tax=Lupinus albus TaxID=3870 RepID=A0A6A4P4H6_LUPAL|nr:hypothetical protein Lalb_Chr14g0364881 [Lupinus albus]
MEKKALIRLLVILLGLSCILYAGAVPATSNSMIRKMVPLVQDHQATDLVVGLWNKDEEFNTEEGVVDSRMMLDVEDYPRTRPNPAHDPKPPGKP